MDFSKYRNTLPYPRRDDFTTVYYYKAGKIVHTHKHGDTQLHPPETKDAVREVFVDHAAYQAASMAYSAEVARINALFLADVKEDLGISNHPKADLLLSKAWGIGDHNFNEVYGYALDLVDLIR